MRAMRPTRRNLLEGAAALGVLASFGCATAPRLVAESDDPARWDAVETAARIARGDISASAVADAAIARAARSEPVLNAIVTPSYDAARERAAGPLTGPFAGVPSFIKDLEDVAGQPTGYGSRAYAGYVAQAQGPFVDAFVGAGFVSLGKSATPEFGLTATTEPLSSGPARNPWDETRSTGGSSGGAAALTAAGVVPLAHASDGGGSIRIPAACCGLVGLKPSRGRLPLIPRRADAPIDFVVDGAVTRTARDAAAFLAVMERRGEDAVLAPVGRVEGPGADRLRIGVFADSAYGAVDPEVAAAVHAAAQTCAGLGHAVEEIAPLGAEFGDDFALFWAATALETVSAWEAATGRDANPQVFEPWTLGLAAFAFERRGDIEDAIGRLAAIEPETAALFETLDVVISPTVAAPAPEIGWLSPTLPFETHLERVTAYAPFTGLHNIAGTPAISLPLAQSAGGLPIGVQFAAGLGRERTLLELAYAFEDAMPWAARQPAHWMG